MRHSHCLSISTVVERRQDPSNSSKGPLSSWEASSRQPDPAKVSIWMSRQQEERDTGSDLSIGNLQPHPRDALPSASLRTNRFRDASLLPRAHRARPSASDVILTQDLILYTWLCRTPWTRPGSHSESYLPLPSEGWGQKLLTTGPLQQRGGPSPRSQWSLECQSIQAG